MAILVWSLIIPSGFAQPVDLDRPYPLALLPYPGPGKLSTAPPGIITFLDNIQVNHDGTTHLQNEEVVCINPTNTDNAVAIWRDFRLGYRRVGIGYTFDGGQTWIDTLLEVPPHPRQSDPVLWVDRNGVFYASTLTLGPTMYDPSGISVQKSTDSGVTWSDRVRVNDDPMYNGCDQFHPWLSIDNDGVIHVCFLDRRDDPVNMLYNNYYTRSTDGGETWEVNHRISTVSSDPGHATLAGLLGEYIGISAWDREVQMVWTDVRNLNQDVFSARVYSDFVPGDVNNNGRLSGPDVTYLVGYFKGYNQSPDPPIWRADANGNCLIGPSDVTYMVLYFKGLGPAPVDGGCH